MSDDEKKYGPGEHPNSLVNLIHIQPGTSGNPAGRPIGLPDIRRHKAKFAREFKLACNMLIDLKFEEIQAIANDMTNQGLRFWAARIIVTAAKNGDIGPFEVLLNRAIGKPKENVNIGFRPSIIELSNGNQIVFRDKQEEDEE